MKKREVMSVIRIFLIKFAMVTTIVILMGLQLTNKIEITNQLLAMFFLGILIVLIPPETIEYITIGKDKIEIKRKQIIGDFFD